jgi:hypothetical protein
MVLLQGIRDPMLPEHGGVSGCSQASRGPELPSKAIFSPMPMLPMLPEQGVCPGCSWEHQERQEQGPGFPEARANSRLFPTRLVSLLHRLLCFTVMSSDLQDNKNLDLFETKDAEFQDLRKRCRRFRVLIMGRANAGKTTILERMCQSTEPPIIKDRQGRTVSNLNMILTMPIATPFRLIAPSGRNPVERCECFGFIFPIDT